MSSAVKWWTNAATDAPDEPSSLMRRLAVAAELCPLCSAGPVVRWGLCEECAQVAEAGAVHPSVAARFEAAPAANFAEVCGRNPQQEPDCGACAGVSTYPDPDLTTDPALPLNWRARAQRVMARHMAVQPAPEVNVVAQLELAKHRFADMEVA